MEQKLVKMIEWQERKKSKEKVLEIEAHFKELADKEKKKNVNKS